MSVAEILIVRNSGNQRPQYIFDSIISMIGLESLTLYPQETSSCSVYNREVQVRRNLISFSDSFK